MYVHFHCFTSSGDILRWYIFVCSFSLLCFKWWYSVVKHIFSLLQLKVVIFCGKTLLYFSLLCLKWWYLWWKLYNIYCHYLWWYFRVEYYWFILYAFNLLYSKWWIASRIEILSSLFLLIAKDLMFFASIIKPPVWIPCLWKSVSFVNHSRSNFSDTYSSGLTSVWTFSYDTLIFFL